MRVNYRCCGEERVIDGADVGIIIGRSDSRTEKAPDVDLSSDRSVSRRHARIWREDEGHWIEDLGSRNGTFVQGVDIRNRGPVPLGFGIPVRVGTTELVLVNEEKEPLSAGLRADANCPLPLNYSLVHADVPLLKALKVFNSADEPSPSGILQIDISDYGAAEPADVPALSPKGFFAVHPVPRMYFDRNRLKDLPEPELAQLQASFRGQRVALIPEREIQVLPPDAWHCAGHEAALAGFVMPNTDTIKEVISGARSYLRRLLPGAQGFADALETADPGAQVATLKALYWCLQERYRVAYEYEPRTYAPDWQLVRFHHQVVEEGAGTCIDLATLLAACLESVHRHPVILLVETGHDVLAGTTLQHAIIGCWRYGSPMLGAVIRDWEQVCSWIRHEQLLVVDSKGYARTTEFPDGMGFSECQERGASYLKEPTLCYAVDVVAARDAGFTPMPFGRGMQFERAAWLAVFRARRQAGTLRSTALCARHLLLGLLSLDRGLMTRALDMYGPGMVRRVVDIAQRSLPVEAGRERPLACTRDWAAAIRCAKQNSEDRGSSLVTELDLALAVLQTRSQVTRVLEHAGSSPKACLEALHRLSGGAPPESEWRSSGFVT